MSGKIAFEEHFSTPEVLIDSERPHGTSAIWPTLKHNLSDMQTTRIAKMLFASSLPLRGNRKRSELVSRGEINEYDKRKTGRENAIRLLKHDKDMSARA